MLASACGHSNIVRQLLLAGAKVDIKDQVTIKYILHVLRWTRL